MGDIGEEASDTQELQGIEETAGAEKEKTKGFTLMAAGHQLDFFHFCAYASEEEGLDFAVSAQLLA